MLDIPCYEVVWRVLVTHSIRQFPFTSSPPRHRVPLHFNWMLYPFVFLTQLLSTARTRWRNGEIASRINLIFTGRFTVIIRVIYVEFWVHLQANQCGTCRGRNGSGTGYPCEHFGFPLSLSFHSTFSFISLSLMPYNLRNWYKYIFMYKPKIIG